jgi:vacuolar-type H+-ATPase subunit H
VNREADQSRNKKFVKARLAALKIQEEMLAKQRFELEKKQKKIMDNWTQFRESCVFSHICTTRVYSLSQR